MKDSSALRYGAARAPQDELKPSIATAILLIFFLAGFSTLAYQVTWVKMLGLTFGVTNHAVTSVLTAFMGGLALGGYLGGRLADRWGNGIRVFGYMEICLGLFALVLPALFHGATLIYRAFYEPTTNSTFMLTVVRFSVTFLLLALPTTLMGATFPVLVRALVGRQESLGSRLASLYSWNNLGSVIGCIGTGYILIGRWGVRNTMWLAAVLSILVGITALVLSKALRPVNRSPGASLPAPELDSTSRGIATSQAGRTALTVTFLSGFAALGYEVVWIRILNLLSDHSIYIFSTIVAIVLVGIALGSRWVMWASKRNINTWKALTVVQAALALCAVLWLPTVWGLARATQSLSGFQTSDNTFFVIGLVVTLIPSLFLGASFPLVAKVYAQEVERTGRLVGEAYSVNVLGAMAGSIVTGFAFIPLVGVQRSLWLLGLVNLLSAVWAARAGCHRRSMFLGVCAIAGLVLVLIFGSATLYGSLFIMRHPEQRLVQLFENVEGTVAVTEEGETQYIFTNGIHDANTSSGVVALHRLIGYLPGFVCKTPRRALVIGLGGGTTSGALAQYVQDRLEIVELSDAMVSAAHLFSAYNYQVLDNPLTKLVVADGRNYLLFSDERYDIITADTIYPMQAYSSNLYSIDYYRLLVAHLNDQGVVVLWIDQGLRDNEQRILMRTFVQAFPYVSLWQNQGVKLLLGTRESITPNREEMINRFTPTVAAGLAPLGIAGPDDILRGFTLKDEELRADLGPGLIISDDYPYNEYFRLMRMSGIGRLYR
ncbi:MAG TPA: fused MFS/spermidine synthase [Blastocatellia bacterium]|nr:fused MFS/spermidine synthase [Blastocatellia bacterium]